MKFQKIITGAVLSFITLSVQAGQYNSVTIDNITVVDNGVARVSAVDAAFVKETSCSTTGNANTARFTFDVTTPVGKSWQSLITSALVSGKKMHLIGTQNCLAWESLSYEKLRNIYLLK